MVGDKMNNQKQKVLIGFSHYLGQRDVLLRIKPAIETYPKGIVIDLGGVTIISMSATIELANLYKANQGKLFFRNTSNSIRGMLEAAISSVGSDKKKLDEVKFKDRSV